MSELIASLERDGYGWIQVSAALKLIWRETYCVWQQLFEAEPRELQTGDVRKPEGYLPLCTLPGGELKQSYYCRHDTIVPHPARAATAAAMRCLCNISTFVSNELREKYGCTMIQYPGRGCLRIMYYPPLFGAKDSQTVARLAGAGSTRAAPHTDLNSITLLPPATALGLEVERSGVWIPVPDRADHVLVQVGRELEAVSARQMRACRHRVRLPLECEQSATRMAMALFVS